MVKPPGMMADVGRSSAAKESGAAPSSGRRWRTTWCAGPGADSSSSAITGSEAARHHGSTCRLAVRRASGPIGGRPRRGRSRRRADRTGGAAPIGARCGGHHLRRRHSRLRRGGASHFGPIPGARHPVRGDRLRRTRPTVPRVRRPAQLVRPGGRRVDGTGHGRLPHRHPRPPRSPARRRGGRGARPLRHPDRRAAGCRVPTLRLPQGAGRHRRRPTEPCARASPPPLSPAPGPTPTEGPTRIGWPARRCRWTTGWTSSTARWSGGCAWRTTCGAWSTVAVWRAPPLEGAPARPRHHDGHEPGPAARAPALRVRRRRLRRGRRLRSRLLRGRPGARRHPTYRAAPRHAERVGPGRRPGGGGAVPAAAPTASRHRAHPHSQARHLRAAGGPGGPGAGGGQHRPRPLRHRGGLLGPAGRRLRGGAPGRHVLGRRARPERGRPVHSRHVACAGGPTPPARQRHRPGALRTRSEGAGGPPARPGRTGRGRRRPSSWVRSGAWSGRRATASSSRRPGSCAGAAPR